MNHATGLGTRPPPSGPHLYRDPVTTELLHCAVTNDLGARTPMSFTDFSRLLWSLGALGGERAYHRELEALIARFDPLTFPPPLKDTQGIVDIVWALASSRHYSGRLLELERALVRSGGMDTLKPRGATTFLWGLATLGHCPADALFLSWPKFFTTIRKAKDAEVATICWSLSVFVAARDHDRMLDCSAATERGVTAVTAAMGKCDMKQARLAGLLRESLREAFRRGPANLSPRARRQISQAFLALYGWTRMSNPETVLTGHVTTVDVAAALEECGLRDEAGVLAAAELDWRAMFNKKDSRTASAFQNEVRDSLQRLGVNFKEEQVLMGFISVGTLRIHRNVWIGLYINILPLFPLTIGHPPFLCSTLNDLFRYFPLSLLIPILDCVIRDRSIVVEVDGPSHFSRMIPDDSQPLDLDGPREGERFRRPSSQESYDGRSPSPGPRGGGGAGGSHVAHTRRALGPTVLKRWLLATYGWNVVSIPLSHWERLRGPEARADFVQDALSSLENCTVGLN